jgi:hypothetical protein
LISVSAVEVSYKLRDIFVNRSGRFKRRVIVSSLANKVLVSLTIAAVIQNFSSVVFG